MKFNSTHNRQRFPIRYQWNEETAGLYMSPAQSQKENRVNNNGFRFISDDQFGQMQREADFIKSLGVELKGRSLTREEIVPLLSPLALPDEEFEHAFWFLFKYA